jgi:hypothetical protein
MFFVIYLFPEIRFLKNWLIPVIPVECPGMNVVKLRPLEPNFDLPENWNFEEPLDRFQGFLLL